MVVSKDMNVSKEIQNFQNFFSKNVGIVKRQFFSFAVGKYLLKIL